MHTTYKNSSNEQHSRSPSAAVPNRADKRSRIIELNDQFRSTFKGGKVVDQLVGVHPKPEIKKRLDALLVG